jgi:4-amino-4-deoxy-L-arabinose transferase-like glycosyltransferase
VREQLGFRIASLSAFVWATTLAYIKFTRNGRPEMALCSFVAIAMLSFYSGLLTENRKKQICYMLVFWISFALAMLAKGPAPLLLMGPALFMYFLLFHKWKYIPKVLPIVGTILFLLIVLPWFIVVLKQYPAASGIWYNEFIGRAEGEYAPGHKPFYYYFEIMFVYMTPYCALVAAALLAPFFKVWQEKRDALWYYWLWFVVGILVMTACGGKRQHYVLPMMPAMAVMVGILLEDMIFVRKAYDKKFVTTFAIGHIIVAVIVAYIFIFHMPNLTSKEVIDDDTTKTLASAIKKEAPDANVIAYCKITSSFIYYLGRDVPLVRDLNDVYAQYSNGAGVFGVDAEYKKVKSDGRFNLFIDGKDNKRGFFLKADKIGE